MLNHIQAVPQKRTLLLLDQRLLPQREEFFACQSCADVIFAIKKMVVRGAPAIGVAAAWGGWLAALETPHEPGWESSLNSKLAALKAARPTAVNLAWAVERLLDLWKRPETATLASPVTLAALWRREAELIQAEDLEMNRRIGVLGAELIASGDTILTHCNAGALATAGYGTALGIIRAAHAAGKKIKVIADETRPLLQGSRLTAWELKHDGIPVRIACDNAAALLMQKGLVHKIVTGADRIAKNGDTANKIGTFSLAILARHFKIPFYVAAPSSTLDQACPTGAQILIEERPEDEVTHCAGAQIAPVGVPAYNYAFDITPAEFITAIITEKGVRKPGE